MPFFPASVIPKTLKRETLSEVDNSPSIINARDFNIYIRELVAIEKYLVGAGATAADGGLLAALSQIINDFRQISNNGLLAQYSGVVKSGDSISVPAALLNTVTTGTSGSGDAVLNVVSTSGFPSSGVLTKFNDMTPTLLVQLDSQAVPLTSASFNFLKQTNQEIVSYTGKTATSFTGCSRAVEGNAQAVPAGKSAVVLGGKCSLTLAHKTWSQKSTGVDHIFAVSSHDAALKVTAGTFNVSGTPIAAVETDAVFFTQYSLNAVGSFVNPMA